MDVLKKSMILKDALQISSQSPMQIMKVFQNVKMRYHRNEQQVLLRMFGTLQLYRLKL